MKSYSDSGKGFGSSTYIKDRIYKSFYGNKWLIFSPDPLEPLFGIVMRIFYYCEKTFCWSWELLLYCGGGAPSNLLMFVNMECDSKRKFSFLVSYVYLLVNKSLIECFWSILIVCYYLYVTSSALFPFAYFAGIYTVLLIVIVSVI